MGLSQDEAADYLIRLDAEPAQIPAAAWNGLLAAQAEPLPFLRHEFLAAVHATGCAAPASGWAPAFLTLWRGDSLDGAVAAWVKSHSYGEYVFDWAWAEAYERHGLAYYPKLLVAVPFTPVPGPRLLARRDEDRRVLLRALRGLAERGRMSSVHLLFGDEADLAAARDEGWLLRQGVQFHWRNRQPRPYADFADFLGALQRDKRKKIAQERRRVAGAGVSFELLEGPQIDEAAWAFFHRCYSLTYRAHHATPYLNLPFFLAVGRALAPHWLMCIARQGGERIAASLLAIDRESGRAWGRYWGATRAVDCLHFEACYYQPLQWCIAQGFVRFEGGAQGEHKMARGLTPVATHSAHWLAHPRFAQAVEDFLAREGQGVAAYLDELRERHPFKSAAEGGAGPGGP